MLGTPGSRRVTYNFDPDKWLENEQLRIEMRRQKGELTADEAAGEIDAAEKRYEEMLKRLDGTFPVTTRNVPPSSADS
jgi:hypothetical protein